MQGALLLVFLLSMILVLAYKIAKVDGFTDLHSEFKTDRLKQHGNIGISTLTADRVGSLGNSATKYTATTPVTTQNDSPLFSGPSGLFSITKTCEAIQTMNCNAFDDPTFSLNCGMCLDIGKNSLDKEIPGGGLVLLDGDKTTARQTQLSNFMTNYVPTVGFCPAGKMVSTKEECIKLQRQLQCQKNQSFDLPGCSQCSGDGSFSIFDPVANPGVNGGSGTIMVVGNGILSIIEQGFPSVTNIRLSNSPYSYTIRGSEGMTITLNVNSESTNTLTGAINNLQLYIGGYVSGETFKGEYDKDLMEITLTDRISGRKPRAAGTIKVGDTGAIKMVPGFGRMGMQLEVTIPFSFADTKTEEASLCQTGPYITKASSAKLLESNPCYAKGTGPGNYSLECLQNIWLSNGCTQSGKSYPADQMTASVLMANPDGTFRSTNDIANFVYNQALISSTGINASGQKQPTERWSDVSIFCTGNPVAESSPCDSAMKGGALSAECIIYLWKNQGANKPAGATYSGYGSSLSEGSLTSEYCKLEGTASPVDANGNLRTEAIAMWQSKGDINAVKKLMSDIHAGANAENSTDEARLQFIRQCYGPIALADRPPQPPPQINTCPISTTNLITKVFNLRRDNILASNFSTYHNFRFFMHITPKGAVGEWSSLLHMTTGKDQFEFGARTLGIFFYPGSINKLALHIDHTTQPGWAARRNDSEGLNVPFVIGKKSLLGITCIGPEITITLDGNVCGSFTHNGFRYIGNVTVYASNPWYSPANCVISSVCYGAA